MTVAFVFLALVLLPAAAAFVWERSFWQRNLLNPVFNIGTPVVYRQERISTRPTPDADDVRPAERGEFYYYSVTDYLRVIEVLGDGRIIATDRNKERVCLWPNDCGLRRARPSERLIYHSRFPHS